MNAKAKPEPKRAAPPPLWRAMRAFLLTFIALFGAPQDVAARSVMRRKDRALMLAWLRAGEAFLRRLLFTEALALIDTPPAPPSPSTASRKPRVRKLMHFYPDKPDDWRVCFRAVEPSRKQSSRSRRNRVQRDPIVLAPAFLPTAPQQRRHTYDDGAQPIDQSIVVTKARASGQLRNAWPLAERLEAMLRAFNDPHTCAKRLACALLRRSDCADRVLTPQPLAIADLFGRYFGPCDRIAAKRWRAWRPQPAPPDTG